MKFRNKFGETMLWVETQKKMVIFENGIAEVDDKIGVEMKKLGYIEDSDVKTKKEKPTKVEEPKVETKEDVVKPIRPLKSIKTSEDDINEEI
jgi:hypothetical protein